MALVSTRHSPQQFPIALLQEAGHSLQVCVDVNLASSESHGTRAPDLSRVDPRVILGRRAQADVLGKVGDRLRSTRHTHAVGGQRNPATVLSFNDGANIKVNAAVGAHPDVVDAPHSN